MSAVSKFLCSVSYFLFRIILERGLNQMWWFYTPNTFQNEIWLIRIAGRGGRDSTKRCSWKIKKFLVCEGSNKSKWMFGVALSPSFLQLGYTEHWNCYMLHLFRSDHSCRFRYISKVTDKMFFNYSIAYLQW